jgi:hypothetical protein
MKLFGLYEHSSDGLEVQYISSLKTDLSHLSPTYDGYAHSEYLRGCLHPLALAERLQRAVAALSGWTYGALACRGVSGLFYTAPLTLLVGRPAIVVRKRKEGCHGMPVEGYREATHYIIIDDFVSTGETARAISRTITEWAPHMHCLGVLQVSRLPDVASIMMTVPYPLYTDCFTVPD